MKNILLTLSTLVLLSGCTNSFKAEQPSVNNDLQDLSSRVTQVQRSMALAPVDPFVSSLSKFTHLADIAAPTIAGHQVKATSILKLDNKILVSYNAEGADVYGGVDVIDISNLLAPTLVSSWQSSVYEFNDMKSKGRALYLAGNKKDVGAVVVVLDIADLAHPVVVNELLVPGNVATSLDVRGDRMFVSSAINGGITQFEVSYNDVLTPTRIRHNPFPNALFVKAMTNPYDASQGLVPFILGGDSDTHLYWEDKELALSPAPSVAPSRMVIEGPLVYVNSSSGGLKVTEISKFYDGRGFDGFLSTLALPGTGNGLAEVDQKVYAARGESGVRYINVDEPGAPVELGYLDFGDQGSANNVWVERYAWNFKVIVVADGLGGVRLVLEDTSLYTNDAGWVQVYAKGTPLGGINPQMEIIVNGVVVSSQTVLSNTWKLYHVVLPSPIADGADVRVRFSNDAYQAGMDDRNLSVGYVKIGDVYYNQWWNNTYLDNGVLAAGPESDNLSIYNNGYIKISR